MHRRRSPAIRLATPTKGDGPQWEQIGKAGTWQGYPSGPLQLTEAIFDQLIRNFRAHPSYEAGEDGIGIARVIPWDFDHASQKGNPAVEGAPAQAWVLELEKRQVGGELALFALTEWLEPAKSYVREGKYAWASMVLWGDQVDPVSGDPIGWLLTSVALTNDPFIQGMQPLAASIDREAAAVASVLRTAWKRHAQQETPMPPTDPYAQSAAAQAQLARVHDYQRRHGVSYSQAFNAVRTAERAEAKLVKGAVTLEPTPAELAALAIAFADIKAANPQLSDEEAAAAAIARVGGKSLVPTAASTPRSMAAMPQLLTAIEASPGVNITERAMNYARTLPGSEKLTYDQLHAEASKLLAAARGRPVAALRVGR